MVVVDAMAAKLVQQPFPSPHVSLPIPRITETILSIHRRTTTTTAAAALVLATSQRKKKDGSGFGSIPPKCAMKASSQSSGVLGDDKKKKIEKPSDASEPALSQIKSELHQALKGINRGIFGAPSEKKSEIEALIKLLESQNPTPDPALNLDKVDGCWKLIYSTITILGPKRTKLGLRDFITLGDFFQTILISERKAVNVIKFNVRGFNMLKGQLTIEASFRIASKSRVDINYNNSTITPDQLMNMFRKNYNLLLSIFNPEGWLEISYVDDTIRIGRDDKGNIFILERSEGNPVS